MAIKHLNLNLNCQSLQASMTSERLSYTRKIWLVYELSTLMFGELAWRGRRSKTEPLSLRIIYTTIHGPSLKRRYVLHSRIERELLS